MSAEPPSNPNPFDEIKERLSNMPDELKAGLADEQPLFQGARPRYSFDWFDKWMLAIPLAIAVVVLLLFWRSCGAPPPPTTVTLQTPAPDAALEVNEPLTITGVAPPNSQVQIYNHGQLVAETQADADGNFIVRFIPIQAGDYELHATATVNGERVESPPIQFVIAGVSGQTTSPLQPTPAANQTSVAAAGGTATSPTVPSAATSVGGAAPGTEGGAAGAAPGATAVAGAEGSAAGATAVPGTEGGAQGATPVPGTEGGAQGGTSGATAVPGTEGGAQGGAQGATAVPGTEGGAQGATAVPGTEGGAQGGAQGATPVPGTEGGAQGGAQGATAVPGTEGGAQGGAQGATPVPGAEGGAQGAATPGANQQAPANALPPTVAILAGQWLAPGSRVTGTGVPGTVVTLYLDDTEIGSTTVDANGNWELVLGMSVEPGDHILRVLAGSPDASGTGAAGDAGNLIESQRIPVKVQAMTLPVTGGTWSKPRACQWLWSACCWR